MNPCCISCHRAIGAHAVWGTVLLPKGGGALCLDCYRNSELDLTVVLADGPVAAVAR